jgi:hypothetical protein
MTEQTKNEIAEKLSRIDEGNLELWGGYYESGEDVYDRDYDGAMYKIDKAVKFIREKLLIPEPKEEI